MTDPSQRMKTALKRLISRAEDLGNEQVLLSRQFMKRQALEDAIVEAKTAIEMQEAPDKSSTGIKQVSSYLSQAPVEDAELVARVAAEVHRRIAGETESWRTVWQTDRAPGVKSVFQTYVISTLAIARPDIEKPLREEIERLRHALDGSDALIRQIRIRDTRWHVDGRVERLLAVIAEALDQEIPG